MKRYLKPFLIVISSLLLLAPLLTIRNPTSSSIRMESNDRLDLNLDPYYVDINSKTDFETWSSSGNGTPSNPFIIENLNLDLSSSSEGGISIFGTGYHFIIRNCVLIGNDYYAGILIWGAENGTITNNNITNFRYGIQLKGASYPYIVAHINVTHNTLIENNWRGIEILGSLSYVEYVRVINNTVLDQDLQSGIRLDGVFNSKFINNTCINNGAKGFWMANSQNNIVLNNTAIGNGDYGFLIEDTYNSNFTQNTAIGNPLDGFRCSDSINIRFHQNIAVGNNEYGFQLWNASYCILTNNSIIANDEHGLYLAYYSSDNNIRFNTFVGNGGDCIFESSSCENNIIENNFCDDIGDGGIPGFQWFLSALGISISISMLGGLLRRKKLYQF